MAEWYRPATLDEALSIRASQSVIPIAGATDLYVRHRRGAGMIPAIDSPLLSIAHLDELRHLSVDSGVFTVRAAVTYAQLLGDERVHDLLRLACAELAAPALRNVATIGGNICNASPAADAVCPLYVLDAECELRSADATRVVPIDEFITGPGTTTLAQDELLVAVRIPGAADPSVASESGGEAERIFYRKVGTRRANALTKVSIAARALLDPDGAVSEAAIALGAVGPTVLRSREIDSQITGPPDALIARREAILDAYRGLVTPINDQRSTADYRSEVAVNLVRAFLDAVTASTVPDLPGRRLPG